MKTYATLIAILSTLVLIGCQHSVAPTVEKCVQGSGPVCTGATCKVDVEVTSDNKIMVSPYTLKIKKRTNPKMIIWKLKEPNKYEFTESDGVRDLKNTDPRGNTNDFSEPTPTDSEDGSTPSKSGRNYRYKFSNATEAQAYEYIIQFREKKSGGKVLACDPYINNQNE